MISWAQAGWLWALTGMFIPLLIHLLNASRGRRTVFPALIFAAPSKARRIRSIALREPWLLALRLLLLALLVCWLAGPWWQASPGPDDRARVLVSPLALQLSPLNAKEMAKQMAIELQGPDAPPPAQLAAGFPPLSAAAFYAGPAPARANELLNGADQQQARSGLPPITVLTADHPLDRRWGQLATAPSVTFKTVDPDPKLLQVALSVAADRATDAPYLRSALAALASRGDLQWQELTGATSQIRSIDQPFDVWLVLGEPRAQQDLEYRMMVKDAPAGDSWSQFTTGGETFRLRRSPLPLEGEPLLNDWSGQPLVAVAQRDGRPVLQFAGRFEGSRNTLVESGLFPDQLGQWLSLVRHQAQPVAVAQPKPPQLIFAALVLALWIIERLLALRSMGAGEAEPAP